MAAIVLLLFIMAPSIGEGRARRVERAPTYLNDVFDGVTTSGQNYVLNVLDGGHDGCYSCLYRGFLFPEKHCQKEKCAGMLCYKVTAFVEGAAPGSPPWVAHGCAQPSTIEMVREEKAECHVLRQVAQKLDPDGGPAQATTFNRCAIHTCDNYANDLPQQACNDGRLGPLWCWQYAIEHDEDIIKDSSKDFYSEADYFRATQHWLQNPRNATKCSEQGLDSCLSLSGWYRGRRWSVQTCADTQAVVEMLDKDESCAYLQDTLSNNRMGKNLIKFSQNSAPAASATTAPSTCVARTCDTNGCNAQVPFFHLRQLPSSAPTLYPPPTTTVADYVTTAGGSEASTVSTSPPPDVTRLSSSLVQDATTTAPSSASSPFPNLVSLVKITALLCACTCISPCWLTFFAELLSARFMRL